MTSGVISRVVVAQGSADSQLADALTGLTVGDWVAAGGVFFGAIVLSRVVKALTAHVVERGEGAGRVAQVVGRMVGALVVVGGFVYALQVLGVRLAPLLGALGIGGLALAFAAQTILENVFASALLQARRPFRSGDQIASNDIEGTVEEVNFRTVVLRTYDGERVLMPCSQVLNSPITNFTTNRTRRTTLAVGVAYSTDLARAQRVLLEAVGSVEGVRAQPTPQAWVEEFGESSIDFALRYWHAPDIATMWRVRSGVAMAVKSAFDGAGIGMPFPQRTLGFLPGSALTIDGGDGGDGGGASDANGDTPAGDRHGDEGEGAAGADHPDGEDHADGNVLGPG